jgi:hypothetical protein
MSNLHIVREPDVAANAAKAKIQGGSRGKVVGEIMGDIVKWRRIRDNDFEDLWDEYYYKWRGFWRPQDRSYRKERSKLIAPLTSMAVDLTAAEIIEAVFGREYFIDLPDNIGDEQQADVEAVRNKLVEDLKNAGFIGEFGSCALNGTLYGKGIMKVQVLTREEITPFRDEDGKLQTTRKEVVDIKPINIDPGTFVPDPGSQDIDMMKGCAHEFLLPLHIVRQRQSQGVYDPTFSVGPYNQARVLPNRGDTADGNRKDKGDVAFITEYYGLVPTRFFLTAIAEANGTSVPMAMLESIDPFDMTECIATIANETHLLRIIPTPLITGERLMGAYSHETVPGMFWGRGVCEKSASVQRAMDAEMRARIDGLAWSNHPMFAGDLNRLPPDTNINAWPGKFWGTRGNPGEILQQLQIKGIDPASFQHMQDLERMGQQATGALDSIMSLRAGVRDETATGSALSASGFIKRSKRTMYNIEDFLGRIIRRTARLKMQYDPQNYPQDYEFSVRGTIGIMAREIEQQFMVNLVQIVGQDSPAAMPIIRAIMEQSGSPAKSEVLEALRAIEEKEPSPQEQAAADAQLAQPVLENKKTQAETLKLFAEGGLKDAQEDKTRDEIKMLANSAALDAIAAFNDLQETENQVRQLDILEDKNEIEREKLRKQPRS